MLSYIFGADPNDGRMVNPLSPHLDKSGVLYVTDQAIRGVHVYDANKNKYSLISEGDGRNLKSPVDVEVSNRGDIFISDSELGEVLVYDKKFKYKYSLRNYFLRPTGLLIWEDRLYVVDTAAHKVLVFDINGIFLYEFGERGVENGQYNYPIFLTARENIYINDSMNFRLQILTKNLQAIGNFGHQGDVQGTFASSKGVATDSDGNIYVSDALFDVVQIFNADGQLLLVFGSPGSQPGQFRMPAGIHIDANDRIYVVDMINGRIQIFQYHGGAGE